MIVYAPFQAPLPFIPQNKEGERKTAERPLKQAAVHHNVAAAAEGRLMFSCLRQIESGSILSTSSLPSVIMCHIYFNEAWGLNKCNLCKVVSFSLDSGVYSGCTLQSSLMGLSTVLWRPEAHRLFLLRWQFCENESPAMADSSSSHSSALLC